MKVVKRIFCLAAICCFLVPGVKAQYEKSLSVYLSTTNKLVPGTTFNLQFTFKLLNNDFEYGDSIAIEFPEGVTPNSVSNDPFFAPTTEGQAPESFNGANGQVVSWGDNNDSAAIGGIEPGKFINFSVNVTVDPLLTGTQTIKYFVSGDKMKYAPKKGIPRDFADSIRVDVADPPANLTVKLERPVSQLYLHPLAQVKDLKLKANVINNGGAMTEYAGLFLEDKNNSFLESIPLPNPTPGGQFNEFTSTVKYQPRVGKVAKLRAYTTNTIDSDPSDNTDSTEFAVSDSSLSHTDDSITGNVSLPGSGAMGTWMEIRERDTLTSVSVYLTAPARNDSMRISVYTFSTQPDSLLMSSLVYRINSFIILPGWFTVTLPDTLVIDSGKFFVAVEQLVDGKLTLATNSFNYFPFNNYLLPVGETTWIEASSADPMFQNSFLIRANFSTPKPPAPQSTVGLHELNTVSLEVSPNPVRNYLSVKASGTYTILSLTGQVVASGETESSKISTEKLSPGTYLLEINGVKTKFIKQ